MNQPNGDEEFSPNQTIIIQIIEVSLWWKYSTLFFLITSTSNLLLFTVSAGLMSTGFSDFLHITFIITWISDAWLVGFDGRTLFGMPLYAWLLTTLVCSWFLTGIAITGLIAGWLLNRPVLTYFLMLFFSIPPTAYIFIVGLTH
jgi:hypothetical protein